VNGHEFEIDIFVGFYAGLYGLDVGVVESGASDF